MDKLSSLRVCIRQTGFSIVELMVAILIGLIILAGVIQVVVTSKTSFIGQEEMSFIQENARYAMDVIGKDVQGAGYWGCAGSDARVALVAGVDNANAQPFLSMLSIRGFADETGVPAAYADNLGELAGGVKSESLMVRSFAGPAIALSSHAGNTLTLVGNHTIKAGSYVGVVAEDCRRVGVVRVSAVTANTLVYTSAQNSGLNTIKTSPTDNIICPGATCVSTYAQNYNPGSEILNYISHAYYIGTSTALPGSPALKRAVLSNGSVSEEEIALGVEDMHLRYGVRDNNNLQYWKAEDLPVADWNKVVAVEVTLLLRSQSSSLPAAEEKKMADDTRSYNDRHMRQKVTSTFRIRNRI